MKGSGALRFLGKSCDGSLKEGMRGISPQLHGLGFWNSVSSFKAVGSSGFQHSSTLCQSQNLRALAVSSIGCHKSGKRHLQKQACSHVDMHLDMEVHTDPLC